MGKRKGRGEEERGRGRVSKEKGEKEKGGGNLISQKIEKLGIRGGY